MKTTVYELSLLDQFYTHVNCLILFEHTFVFAKSLKNLFRKGVFNQKQLLFFLKEAWNVAHLIVMLYSYYSGHCATEVIGGFALLIL